jgi:hypothetical protein
LMAHHLKDGKGSLTRDYRLIADLWINISTEQKINK